ncbi:hypothetical protein ABZ345_02735 [Lentzea sp. NPDC005914]|uniref:hypothetical protein n=1 Tax=Lentzea sp. NPDC005914 TaxID=3154572 RepID=UPI0033D00D96
MTKSVSRLISALATVSISLGAIVVGAAPASAAGCDVYRVIENAYVRENPDNDSVVRKTKYAGEEVRNCFGTHAGEPGSEWTAVNCTCATDGQGWIISRKLQWLRYEG